MVLSRLRGRAVARRRVVALLVPMVGSMLVSACGTYQTGSVQEGTGYSFPKIREGHDRYMSDEDREKLRKQEAQKKQSG